jgi:hypothetical protein
VLDGGAVSVTAKTLRYTVVDSADNGLALLVFGTGYGHTVNNVDSCDCDLCAVNRAGGKPR